MSIRGLAAIAVLGLALIGSPATVAYDGHSDHGDEASGQGGGGTW